MEFSTMAGRRLNLKKSYEAGALADWHAQDRNSAPDDQSLIERVAAKDVTALAILYDRYAEMVYSVVRPILTDQGAAEGIIPDIFCQLWSQAPAFRPGRRTVAEFLLVLTRKCAINRLLGPGVEHGERLQADPSGFSLDLEPQITPRDLMARVKNVLGELPHSQPVSFERLNLDGVITGGPGRPAAGLLGTIKTRMQSALRALKELPAGAFQSSKQKEPRKSRSQIEMN